MCRWVAYAGKAIYLDEILFHPENSIVRQSLSAKQSPQPTNGDGFGVAWYGLPKTPGLYKDTLPAWNDSNLKSLAAHIRTRLFFSHVRASSGTAITRTNCHPFTFQNWSFMHNGQIGNWPVCRKLFESHISPKFYPYREGSTDSEAFFLVALSLGLQKDPILAITSTIQLILKIMKKNKVKEAFRSCMAISDGKKIWAFRYSSDHQSPSLYYGTPSIPASHLALQTINTIASEPLDAHRSHWHKIEEGSALMWSKGVIKKIKLNV